MHVARQTNRHGGASRSNEMHRRFMRDGRILNCRTGVEPDTRCPTGIPAKIEGPRANPTALGPSLPIDNVLLILKNHPLGWLSSFDGVGGGI